MLWTITTSAGTLSAASTPQLPANRKHLPWCRFSNIAPEGCITTWCAKGTPRVRSAAE